MMQFINSKPEGKGTGNLHTAVDESCLFYGNSLFNGMLITFHGFPACDAVVLMFVYKKMDISMYMLMQCSVL